MGSEWPIVRLGDYVDSSLGKMLDAKKNKGELHPYLGNSNVRWGQFDLNNLAEMRFEEQEQERYQLLPGDLVVCEGGEPGRCAIWRGQVAGMKIQKALHRVRAKPGLKNEYLYYWFTLAARRGILEPYFTGTTIKHLTGRALTDLAVPLPPTQIQESIVSVLGVIDEKIDCLRQTNVTLEAIAQALFKSWFVDFDPVRAKAEGREPEGMDAATAALFPSKFEDSELGRIPKGWTAGRLADVVELKYGKSLRAADRNNGEIPVYGSGGVTGFHDKPLIEGPTVIVGRKGTVGSIYWESLACFPIDTVFYVESKRSLYFAYFALQQAGLDSLNTDAAVPGLNRNNAYRQPVVIPPPELIHAWDVIAGALRSRIDTSQVHAANLSQLRDALLPRLISGKLRLPEAEREIDAATA